MQRLATMTSRFARTLTNVCLIVITLACTAYLLPSAFGYERYVITGGSMTGSISKGSIAFEKRVPVDELAVGDVITYLPPSASGVPNLVTHRIVEVGTDAQGASRLRTKGDANPAVDPWTFSLVATEQPVVQFSVPKVGYLFIALADRDTRILVIGVPAGIIALLALVELVRNVAGSMTTRGGGVARTT
ncbi:signal peptidase I [Knoellia sp. LjRoot47]|uniref:signal peptidase I n=1 Tax=Knoellia sp. LjRoot47 TaxID=3342330 RepID=UPI003ECDD9BC